MLAAVFVGVERRMAARGGDPLLNLAVLRAPGLVPGLAAVAVLMITYGGFLFSFALHLQAGLGDSALRAGLTFAPCALVFGACGYFWRRLPRPGITCWPRWAAWWRWAATWPWRRCCARAARAGVCCRRG